MSETSLRLSKLMSLRGLCSRREADVYIARGWVKVNGVPVTELGTKVLPDCSIELLQAAQRQQNESVTLLLNKPVAYVSAQAENGYKPASMLITAEHHYPGDESGIVYTNEHAYGLAPAGRLDIDSSGLLVLTKDGRIAKQLIGENSEVDKEYLVRVEGTLSAQGLQLLNHGLKLDGVALRPAQVAWQNEDQLSFILHEGKKRQIRRMCELVGLKVIGLKRVRIGKVLLGNLPVGQWRYLAPNEHF